MLGLKLIYASKRGHGSGNFVLDVVIHWRHPSVIVINTVQGVIYKFVIYAHICSMCDET